MNPPLMWFVNYLRHMLLAVFYLMGKGGCTWSRVPITSFFGHLPHYHWRMASIVSQIGVVLVNRVLSDGHVN